MRLPNESSSYEQYLRYGRYLARRLRRARLPQLAASIEKSTKAVLDSGRAWEDADGPIQEAIADRDAVADALEAAAQLARIRLAGRGVEAIRTAPYTEIFPEGVTYYTEAPLDQTEARYAELRKRVEDNLAAKDEVRVEAVKSIAQHVPEFSRSGRALTEARTAGAMAGTRYQSAVRAWVSQVEKTYGALVAELGRNRAEAFFPRARTRKVAPKNPVAGAPALAANG